MELLLDEHLTGAPPLERRSELELRRAELLEPVQQWPAGTRGTIVDAFSDEAVLEITDDHGAALALLALPYEALSVLPERHQTRLAL